jgi:pimeloyl-ACP methyl ester carboxylesterase
MNQQGGFDYGLWPELFPLGISCCFFDFAGCGKGTDEFITLGIREKDELAAVLDHLRAHFGCERFVLWGLSMGGLSAMALIPERTDIAAAVIDEPTFSVAANLLAYATQYCNDPSLYDDAREMIREATGVDVESIDLREIAPSVTVPIAFIRGYKKQPPTTHPLFEAVASPKKKLLTFRGSHNGFRSEQVFDESFALIAEALGIPYKGLSS